MTYKEKIIAYIDKLLGKYPKNYYLLTVAEFIDSLQEEPQVKESAKSQHINETCKENGNSLTQRSVSEDLEEAAKHYLYSNILYDDVYVGNPTDKDCIEMFKAGANWQKQQMMAKAVDGVVTFDYYGDDDKTYGCIAHDSFCLEDFGLKDLDKVKMILIKED